MKEEKFKLIVDNKINKVITQEQIALLQLLVDLEFAKLCDNVKIEIKED
jgi:hypothetical protein